MFTICIDPGHGGTDRGAVRGGLAEATVTLDVARAAQRALTPRYRVVLTREDDRTVTLADRVAVATNAHADFFASLHVNAADNGRAGGYEVFVRSSPSPESLALASAMLVQFARRWPDRRNRGLKTANFLVVRQSRPACLIECFFLTNPTERALLALEQTREALGETIAWGCGNFIAGTLLPET